MNMNNMRVRSHIRLLHLLLCKASLLSKFASSEYTSMCVSKTLSRPTRLAVDGKYFKFTLALLPSQGVGKFLSR